MTPIVGQIPLIIAGWGAALPATTVTNADLEAVLDTTDDWIATRTGIRARRIATDSETTLPLALGAARRALDRAALDPDAVDLVIVATSTPEHPMPSTASEVAAELGTRAGAFDVNAACAGFTHALCAASGMLRSGLGERALVIGADTMSRVIDPCDRSTAVLFGDGAGAIVLRTDAAYHSDTGGLVAADVVSDGEGRDLLTIHAGGARFPASAQSVQAGEHYMRMQGQPLFQRAVRAVTASVERTLSRAGCSPADVRWFLPHQANVRMCDAIAKRIDLPAERVAFNGSAYGNTSAASIPILLAEWADAGRFGDGDLVLFSGFGAGLSVSTVLWRWST